MGAGGPDEPVGLDPPKRGRGGVRPRRNRSLPRPAHPLRTGTGRTTSSAAGVVPHRVSYEELTQAPHRGDRSSTGLPRPAPARRSGSGATRARAPGRRADRGMGRALPGGPPGRLQTYSNVQGSVRNLVGRGQPGSAAVWSAAAARRSTSNTTSPSQRRAELEVPGAVSLEAASRQAARPIAARSALRDVRIRPGHARSCDAARPSPSRRRARPTPSSSGSGRRPAASPRPRGASVALDQRVEKSAAPPACGRPERLRTRRASATASSAPRERLQGALDRVVVVRVGGQQGAVREHPVSRAFLQEQSVRTVRSPVPPRSVEPEAHPRVRPDSPQPTPRSRAHGRRTPSRRWRPVRARCSATGSARITSSVARAAAERQRLAAERHPVGDVRQVAHVLPTCRRAPRSASRSPSPCRGRRGRAATPKCSCAPPFASRKRGHHLVEHEQRAVPVRELAHSFEVARLRQRDVDRLHHDRRDLPGEASSRRRRARRGRCRGTARRAAAAPAGDPGDVLVQARVPVVEAVEAVLEDRPPGPSPRARPAPRPSRRRSRSCRTRPSPRTAPSR